MFEEYADSVLEDIMWIATFFYDELSITMKIDTKFRFVPIPYSKKRPIDKFY